MGEARRKFLMTLAAVASCFVATNGFVLAQQRKSTPFPCPPQPADTPNPAEAAATAAKQDPQISKRTVLLQNEKEFRAGVSRLNQLVSELKEELDRTVTTDVFSVQMYKRTEEIERLAKQLKGKARG
jgi:hypothetical protein